nr:ATP-binding protein [Sandaracinobacteroides sayramensis]
MYPPSAARPTRVEIALSFAADGVRLLAKDDGPGVSEAEVPKLTKRLYSADDSRTRPGRGFGLTLVFAILELHKASLQISGYPGFAVEVRFGPASPA